MTVTEWVVVERRNRSRHFLLADVARKSLKLMMPALAKIARTRIGLGAGPEATCHRKHDADLQEANRNRKFDLDQNADSLRFAIDWRSLPCNWKLLNWTTVFPWTPVVDSFSHWQIFCDKPTLFAELDSKRPASIGSHTNAIKCFERPTPNNGKARCLYWQGSRVRALRSVMMSKSRS